MSKSVKKNPSRRDFIKTAVGAMGAVTIGGALIGPRKVFAAEPIKLGLINPLEGECAQWGVPILRGGQLWADEHNAQGGILCGDGARHPIEYDGYTNVCYFPNEELKAAKKAVLEDKKNYLFQTYTPACRKAVADLVTQNKVFVNSYGAGYLSATHPYLMGGITGCPTGYALLVAYLLEQRPEIKKVAILFTDDSYGLSGRWYSAAGCEPYKDRVEVIYNRTFDPKLSDYYPLLGAVFREEPDAILTGILPPGKQALLLETANQLGWDGLWGGTEWELTHILKRVSPDQIEGRLFSVYAADASVPGFHPRVDNLYKNYCERYGAEEYIVATSATYTSMCSWEPGLQEAKSVDPTTVMNTLYSMPAVEHPIYGKSLWGGKEIFGASHHLLTPCPIYTVKGGKGTLAGVFDLGPWWAKHKDVAVPVLKEGGQTFI